MTSERIGDTPTCPSRRSAMNRAFAYWLRLVTLLALGWIATPLRADVVTYFHNDIAGTPMAATDQSGNLVWKESYRPYGERLRNQAGPDDNRLWFGGKSQDPDTGLSYLGARYYNPQLGRFTGIDPKEVDPEDPHSFNRYAYGNNNPYKFVDPDGRSPLVVLAVGIGLWIGGEILTPMPDLPPGSGRIEPTTLPDLSGALGGLKVGLAAMAARGAENAAAKAGIEAAAKRTFMSSDKHVADVANAIEDAYPGHVVGVNVPFRDAAGKMVTDADILLKNAAIQVKSGGGKGMTSQLQRTEQATGLPTIGYGPNLKRSILQNSTSTNDLQLLIDVVKP